MASYDDLKVELLKISKIVEQFPEPVMPRVFELLVEHFLAGASAPAPANKKKTPQKKAKVVSESDLKKKVTPSVTKPKRVTSKESYSIDPHLDLRGDGSIPSFKEYFEEKAPKSAKQFNAVAVYYLRKIKGMSNVTLGHVYTCYSEVKQKPPKAFRQSFIDTKNREAWIEIDAEGNLDIPHRGVVFVEHDLPNAPKS